MRRSISLLCGCLAWMWAIPVAAAGPPAPIHPVVMKRDHTSDALLATGGAALSFGITLQLVGAGSLYAVSRLDAPVEPILPFVEMGCGVLLATIGTAFFSVGAKRHKHWKAGLLDESARVQLQPMVGFMQLGVAGRF